MADRSTTSPPIDRRKFLRAIGGAGAAGLALGSGCVRGGTDTTGAAATDSARSTIVTGATGSTDEQRSAQGCEVGGQVVGRTDANRTRGDTSEWRYDVGGDVDSVAVGLVFGRERHDTAGLDGGIFALDVATGERRWRFGETRGPTDYTDIAVSDAIYVGGGDDAMGNGSGDLYAIEFDGRERWHREDGSVYKRPRVADGVVYAGSDDGAVRAVDAADGSEVWVAGDVGLAPDVVGVDGAVVVESDDLAGLDPCDGAVRWRYGGQDEGVAQAVTAEGVAYLSTTDRIAAVADGTERWSVDVEAWIRRVGEDHVYVNADDRLHAFETATGERVWTSTATEPWFDVHDGVAYVAGDTLAAFDTADWTERWRVDLDEAPAESVAAGPGSGRRAVFVQTGPSRLVGFRPDGRRFWSAAVDSDIRNYVVDGHVFVGADEGVHSLDPSSDTQTP